MSKQNTDECIRTWHNLPEFRYLRIGDMSLIKLFTSMSPGLAHLETKLVIYLS